MTIHKASNHWLQEHHMEKYSYVHTKNSSSSCCSRNEDVRGHISSTYIIHHTTVQYVVRYRPLNYIPRGMQSLSTYSGFWIILEFWTFWRMDMMIMHMWMDGRGCALLVDAPWMMRWMDGC